jgi:CheY-like chemotaxis protein
MAEAESVPLPKLRILLAEDHPVNQKLATTLLKKQGHEVVVASNGRLALEQVQLQPFDLVLMDLQMPEMDGFETTARIREWEATSSRRVRIIALTAHAMKGDRERCLDSGMDGYVSKPIRVAELNAELARFWSPVCESSRVSEGPELQKALEFVEGDRELFRELIQLFLDDSPRLLNELQQAIESKDAKTTQRAAHTLKGTLLNFDAIEAAECARRIEACARECQLEEAGPICTELIRTLTSLEMTLKRWSAEA